MKEKKHFITRLLSVLLCMALVVTYMPLTAFGTETSYAASVTTAGENGVTTSYATLDEAIAAAAEESSSTLKLLDDVNTNVLISSGTFTFDLNGHTMEADTKFYGAEMKYQYVLTIGKYADITLIGSGSIISNGPKSETDTTSCGCIGIQGTLTIDGSIELKTDAHRYSDGIYNSGGNLIIRNCFITAKQDAVSCYNGSAIIYGGTFQGERAICVEGTSTCDIYGGTFQGTSYDLYATEKVSVEGSDEKVCSLVLDCGENGTGAVFPGGITIHNAFTLTDLLAEHCYYSQNGQPVDMTGVGTEIAEGDVAVSYCDHSGNSNEIFSPVDDTNHSLNCSVCSVVISQGAHSLEGGICKACGFGCSHGTYVTENGTIKCEVCPVRMVAQVGDAYYPALGEAVTAASATAGSTLTLLADVTGAIAVPSGSAFTLDLNGKTLYGKGRNSAITVNTSSTLTMKSSVAGGKVTGCNSDSLAGTVKVYGTFNMESGAITGNKADLGGGVNIQEGTFKMTGGEITDNEVRSYGGAVYMAGENADFTMDGGSISGNTVKADDKNYQREGLVGGGGVYIRAGTFTMNGGTIENNQCAYTRGGGVMVTGYGRFLMNGGKITGNTAAEKGGGVYVMNGWQLKDENIEPDPPEPMGTLTVNGNSIIENNQVNGAANNVYLDPDASFAIGNQLSKDAKIAVTSGTTITEEGFAIVSSGATELNKSAVYSDSKDQYGFAVSDGKLYMYPHSHNWSYTLDGNDTIKANCSSAYCPVNDGDGGSMKLLAPENPVYNGKSHTANVEGSIYGIETPEIVYDREPVNAGAVGATITVGEGENQATAEVNFTIGKAVPSQTFFVSSMPKDAVYDGSEKAASVNVKEGIYGIGEYTVYYKKAGVKASPIDAGDYTVYVDVNEGENYKALNGIVLGSFRIAPVTPAPSPDSTPNPTPTPDEDGSDDSSQPPTPQHTTHTWDAGKVTTKATFTKAGVKTFTCTVAGCGKTKTQTIAKLSSVKLSETAFTYNGKLRKPAVTVKDSKGNKIAAKYYSVSYKNNKNAGTATATVSFKTNYAGSKELTFKIKPKKITKATLGKTTYTYNGKAKMPAVTVKSGTTTLLSKKTKGNKSVSLTYAKGRTKVGTYKVTIKGKGNYTGTITKSFEINPNKASILKPKAGKKQIAVKWKKVSKQATGYEVMYSTSKTFKKGSPTKTKIVKSYKKTSLKITKLKAKKTYYVKVRTYKTTNGKKYYSGWSTAMKVKTK